MKNITEEVIKSTVAGSVGTTFMEKYICSSQITASDSSSQVFHAFNSGAYDFWRTFKHQPESDG